MDGFRIERSGGDTLRIAMVAPLHESVPPRFYGGTERVVSYLTEELVRLGHDVTLYASADSRTGARLRPMAPQGLRLDPSCRDPIAPHIAMIEEVLADADDFDVIHFHVDYLHFPATRRAGVAHLTTLHGRLDMPELVPIYTRFPGMPLVSISQAQRGPIPWANWVATVHHGLPSNLLRPGAGDGGYLAFVGRISPEKGPDHAIRIARRAGIPIRIAAKIERADRSYFERVVEPMLDGPGVEFVGEIGEREKNAFLGEAAALLFPIDWPEPFGLVMIESMACGTPVIAYGCGSVPEVIDADVTGWVVGGEDEALEAIARLEGFDRDRCRRRFERRFSAERMALDYLEVYRALGRNARAGERAPRAAA